MKHPFQLITSNKAGDVLFTATKNQLQVFSVTSGQLLGSWVDDIDTTESLRAKIKAERERQLKENALKAEKEGVQPKKKRKSNNSEPKIPTPGDGAPTIYNYIRSLQLTPQEEHLVCTTDSDKSCIVFKLNFGSENCLELIKRQPFPKRPSAITTTTDGSTVLLGDKFGDVYKVPIDSQPPVEINSETDPVLGHVSMLTDLLLVKHDSNEYLITCDRDEHIRVSHYPQGFIIKSFLFGHEEFVNTLLVPSFQPNVLISAGGDDYIISWDWVKGEKLDKFDIRDLVELDDSHLAPSKFQNANGDLKEISVAEIKELPSLHAIVVLVEATKSLLVIKLDQETGKMSLFKRIDFPNKVISFTSTTDKIIVSLESDSMLSFVDLETLEISKTHDALDKIVANSSVEIENKEQLFPLYTTYQLRKRSEH